MGKAVVVEAGSIEHGGSIRDSSLAATHVRARAESSRARVRPVSPPMFRNSYPRSRDDSAEVEYLFDLAFAPGRTALSSYRLRDGVGPDGDLSLVAARRVRHAGRGDPLLAGAGGRGRRLRCCSGRSRCTRPARARASAGC